MCWATNQDIELLTEFVQPQTPDTMNIELLTEFGTQSCRNVQAPVCPRDAKGEMDRKNENLRPL